MQNNSGGDSSVKYSPPPPPPPQPPTCHPTPLSTPHVIPSVIASTSPESSHPVRVLQISIFLTTSITYDLESWGEKGQLPVPTTSPSPLPPLPTPFRHCPTPILITVFHPTDTVNYWFAYCVTFEFLNNFEF